MGQRRSGARFRGGGRGAVAQLRGGRSGGGRAAWHQTGTTAGVFFSPTRRTLLAVVGLLKRATDGTLLDAALCVLTVFTNISMENDAMRWLPEEEDIDGGGGTACQSHFVVAATSPFHFAASQRLPEWLQSEDDHAAAETPFMMAHGAGFFAVAGRDLEFGALFNESMAADSRFVAEILARRCDGTFAGVTSLVDVGGGDGTTAKAIAKAFPHVRCSVLELPQVVDKVPVHGTVEFVAGDMMEFVAGDMMEFVPPADVVLLKLVLHNWSDEDCVRILKQSMLAISAREPKGKVVIIDTVASSASKQSLEAQLPLRPLALPLPPPVLPVSCCVVGRWLRAAGGAAPSGSPPGTGYRRRRQPAGSTTSLADARSWRVFG